MPRRLTLKSERLTELVDAELAAIAGAQGVPTKDCVPSIPLTECLVPPSMIPTCALKTITS